jgi:hypothetical protein
VRGSKPRKSGTGVCPGFPSAKLIEHGREEIAQLMREWEGTAKLIEEQEVEIRE